MEFDSVLLPLLIKVVAAALVVVIASIVSERAGPSVGGIISTLPVSTGPAYLLLALEHDDRFIADSALSSLVTNTAMILFLTALVRLAPRLGMVATVGLASALWIGVSVVLRALGPWSMAASVTINLAAYGLAALLVRQAVEHSAPLSRPVSRWYDIPARAVLVGVLVASVTTASHIIGPTATGIAAIYPIALTSLAVILHSRLGGTAVSAAMRSALVTNPGFLLCVIAAHLTAEPLGRYVALSIALVVSVGWAVGVLAVRRRG